MVPDAAQDTVWVSLAGDQSQFTKSTEHSLGDFVGLVDFGIHINQHDKVLAHVMISALKEFISPASGPTSFVS